MGCPQSKSKSKSLSSAAENGVETSSAKSSNDAAGPDSSILKRTTAKAPNESNDYSKKDLGVKSSNGAVKLDPLYQNSRTAKTKKETEYDKQQSKASGKQNEQPIHDPQGKTDNSFQNVFISDDVPSDAKEGYDDATVDVTDVDVGQAVTEITLDNQTVETGSGDKSRENENISVTKIEGAKPAVLETEDGYLFTEKINHWEGPSAVRYVSKEKIEYGLPEGVPKPAPPKSRKSDIVKPTTFTVVDQLVDSAPDNAFKSVPKLASYLSGVAKKSELASAGDDDDDTDGTKLPSPKPVKTKKTDLVASSDIFKHVDENAKNTPEAVCLSVDKLTAHLCSVANSDLEKVRAFYVWVCNNISYVYDRDKSLSDKLRFDAVSTLRQGQGSFVNLMVALCKETGIPVVTIPGCSKGLRHQPDKQFTIGERNHSWNAVYINGEWRFMDCTWGSGFLDNSGKFRRQFDEFWFLTDPEIFVYDHFPAHEAWQLLEEPISIEEFNKKPSLTEKSKELGFKLISHREPIIHFDNEVSISFSTETFPLSNITSDLSITDGKEINQHRCMKRLDEKSFEIRVVPPKTGEYKLALYGKAKDYRHAKFRKLMEYTLRCEKVYDKHTVFPDHRKAWGAEPNYAELGFAESINKMSVFVVDKEETNITLEQTKNVPICAELKAASDIKTELKGYTMITANDNSKSVHIRFPSSGFYRLDVYAEGESEKFEYASLFLFECTVDKSPKKYPKCNEESISKNVCEILEPKNYELPANTNITFKIRSRGLKNVMVGIPTEETYGARMERLCELKKTGDVFSGEVKTPKEGETLYLSGCAAPPNVFWSRIYEYRTV